MKKPTPQPNGPSFIPITLTGDKDPVTEPCTVTFEATASNGSQPNLVLTFFEVQQTSAQRTTYLPINVSPTPSITWNNGIGTFALVMNNAIFSQLSSNTTHFAVNAAVNGNPNQGWGESIFAIALTS